MKAKKILSRIIRFKVIESNRGQTTFFSIIGDRPRFFVLCFSLIPINQQLTMQRRPRIVLPGVPLHLIQRGNNRQACFFTEDDYRYYLEWLITYAKDAGCAVHAYVLMTNHVHLLLTPTTASGAGE
ncbi:transposase, partial [Thiolapillus sp.]